MQISAIIPVFNEEDHIIDAIESVSWADEIIVVDSFSTDKTLALAQSKGVKILQRAYQYSASQKNWAIPQAKYDWVFILDADERVNESLKEEILKLKKETTTYDAFWIPRQNHFMGKKVRFSGWQGDKVIRLLRKEVCQYEDKKVHAEVICSGKVGKMKSPLMHYTFKSIAHYMEKWDRYSTWSAQDHLKSRPPHFFHLILKPAFRFFRDFILRGGFLDGKTGYIVCKLSSMGVFMRYVKIQEKLNQ